MHDLFFQQTQLKLFKGGHLHDGGINLLIKNNQNTVCDSIATYTKAGEEGGGLMAAAPGKKSGGGSMTGMSHSRRDGGPHGAVGDGQRHIKQMSTCSMLGPVKKGDVIHIEANYDYSQFPGIKSTEIMGIAILYSAFDMLSPAEAIAVAPAKGAAKSTAKQAGTSKGSLKGLLSSKAKGGPARF